MFVFNSFKNLCEATLKVSVPHYDKKQITIQRKFAKSEHYDLLLTMSADEAMRLIADLQAALNEVQK